MISVSNLRRINTLLLIVILAINGYVIGAPLLPGFLFWLHKNNDTQVRQLEQKIHASATSTAGAQNQPAARDDRLIIPNMLLDEPIFTGRTAKTLQKGLWLRPQGTTPDLGGNTIIAGHRFTYTDPQGSLYHLDKVKMGDEIALYWQGKQYTYTVRDIRVVKATETSIEAPSDTPRLTLYTCTPLWLPKDRLVVIAERISE